MNRKKTVTLVMIGHFAALLAVGYISGCSSSNQSARRVLIKDQFAESGPQPRQYAYNTESYAPAQTYTPAPRTYNPAPQAYNPEPQTNTMSMSATTGSAGGVSYTVKKGDTLYSISRKYGVKPNVLASKNNLNNANVITVGQVIYIPSNGATVQKSTTYAVAKKQDPQPVAKVEEKEQPKKVADYKPLPASTVRQTTTYAIHTIKRGENIWRIADRYKVSVDSICDLNSIDRNTTLVSGERIKIPVN